VTRREPLILATEASGSGLGRFAVELANALAAMGHPVTMVAPAQPWPLGEMRQVIVSAPRARGGWRKLVELARQSLGVAAAVLREAGPDRPVLLVHLAPTLPVSLAPILAARLKRARIALSLHDFYPHAAHFPVPLHGLERWLYRAAYRRCDLVITNNFAQSRRLVAEAGVVARRVHTLFHGPFVVSGLLPAEPGAELRLLAFGSLRPNKRVLETIWAVRQLRDQGHRVSLRIAGAPRREDAAYWARCLAEIPHGDPGFDIQPRFFADDELAGLLSGMDALLCPYADFDSQSGVAVTGVSNALPVIATFAARVAHVDLAGAPWPQVAPAADAEDIATAVLGFIAIPTLDRRAFAAALQQRFLAAAGWETLAARYIEAMRELAFWP
jgi:glycogen(starch) synthase